MVKKVDKNNNIITVAEFLRQSIFGNFLIFVVSN